MSMSTSMAQHDSIDDAIESSQDGVSDIQLGQSSKSGLILKGDTKGHKKRGTVTVTVSKMDDTSGPKSDADTEKNVRTSEHADTSKSDEEEAENAAKEQLDDDTMVQIGTVLSLFFQDNKGKNVVDALVQNTKVHHKISQYLERIVELLDKQVMSK